VLSTSSWRLANEKLWPGILIFPAEDNSPAFRHAVLLRGISAASAEQVEILVDIALSECRALLSGIPVRRVGRQGAPASDRGGR